MQGVPVVQSPGEGEAMCAALNKAGLADACATFDGDVLLFGAHTVFHTLKLQVSYSTECCASTLSGAASLFPAMHYSQVDQTLQITTICRQHAANAWPCLLACGSCPYCKKG